VAASSSYRFLLLIGLAFALTIGTAGLLKAGLDVVLPESPWLQELLKYQETTEPSYDLARASRRSLMLFTLVLFIALRRWTPWAALTRKGLAGHGRARNLGYGILVAAALVSVYTVTLLSLGYASWAGPSLSLMLRKLVEYSAGAALIALLEEIFFRGALFRLMLRDWGVCTALWASSLVYALLHIVSGRLMVTPGWQPLVGLRLLRAYVTDASGSVLPDLLMVIGLLLLGWLLAYLYLRTGSLWASIGLHGGIIFFSKLMKKALDRADGFPEWLLGDPLFIVSGVACWLLVLLTIWLVVRTAPRGRLYRRLQRSSEVS
jgi:membrane protease YdiL (CAAX protease family)